MMSLGKRTLRFHPGTADDTKSCTVHVFQIFMSVLSMATLCLSYPYSEDYTKPTQYMNTRCPAWCDRILMSHSAKDIILRTVSFNQNTFFHVSVSL